MHVANAIRRIGRGMVHQAPVIPEYQVSQLPLMAINHRRVGRIAEKFIKQCSTFMFIYIDERLSETGIDVERLAASFWMGANDRMNGSNQLFLLLFGKRFAVAVF